MEYEKRLQMALTLRTDLFERNGLTNIDCEHTDECWKAARGNPDRCTCTPIMRMEKDGIKYVIDENGYVQREEAVAG